MKQEDAILAILEYLRSGKRGFRQSTYGYDVYLPRVVEAMVRRSRGSVDSSELHNAQKELFPVFVDAAWELARRGIVRPGVKAHGAQFTDDGSAGSGYSLTAFGRKWLSEENEDVFVPTEPGRFAEMLEPYVHRFGAGFHERAQQAVRCYGAHAYLACCAMCGAAGESILLAAAIEKEQDSDKVLRLYSSAGGRRKVENLLIGKAQKQVKNEFSGLTMLIKYWRDEAAHGTVSKISDNEAYTALAILLRFAMFIDRTWVELTTP